MATNLILEHHPHPKQLEAVHWQLEIPRALPHDMVTPIYMNEHLLGDGELTTDRALSIGGYGELRWAIESGLAAWANLGVSAIGAVSSSTKNVPATTLGLTAYASQFGPRVITDLQDRGLLQQRPTTEGHSLGGALLGCALQEAPELVGDVAFLEPAGHSTAFLRELHPEPGASAKEFSKRFRGVLLGRHEAPLVYQLKAGRDLGRQLFRDNFPPTRRRYKALFGVAEATDVAPAVLSHAGHKDDFGVVYVFGGKDGLVRTHEVMGSLHGHAQQQEDQARLAALRRIQFISTEYGHAYRGFPGGADHLTLAAGALGLIRRR